MAIDLGILGDLVIQVGADLNPLDQALNRIPGMAEKTQSSLNTTFGSATAGADLTASAVGRVSTQMDLFSDAAKGVQTSQMNLFDTKSIDAMDASFGSLTNSVEEAKAPLEAVAKVDFEKLGGQLKDVGAGMMVVGGILSGVSAGIVGVGVGALEAAGKMEQAKVGFTTFLGSAQAADKMLKELIDFAVATPFEIPGITEAATRLLSFGFAGNQVIPMLRTLGDAASGSGKGITGLNALVLAFGEMSSKGVASLRQLNMMIPEGVNGVEILAKAYGKSTQEMTGMITSKMVPAAEAIPILLAAINDRFGGMMDAQSHTLLGMWSNLKDAITKTLIAIGDSMLPTFKAIEEAIFPVLTGVQHLAEWFGELPEPIRLGTIAVAGLVAVIGPLTFALGGLVFAAGQLLTLVPVFAELGVTIEAATGIAIPSMAAMSAAVSEFALVSIPAAISAAAAFATTLMGDFLASIAAASISLEGLSLAGMMASVITGLQAGALAMSEFGMAAVAAFSTEGIGSLISGLASSITGLATGAMPLLIGAISALASAAVLAGGAFAGWAFGTWLYNNVPAMKAFGDGLADLLLKIPGFESALHSLAGVPDTVNASVSRLSATLSQHGVVVQRGTMTEQEYGVALMDAARAAGLFGTAQDQSAASARAMQAEQAKLNGALKSAQAAYTEMVKLHKEGAASADDVARALAAVRSAAAAAHPELTAMGNAVEGVEKKILKAVATYNDALATWQRINTAYINNKASADELAAAEKALGSAYDALHTKTEQHLTDVEKIIVAQNNAKIAAMNAQDTYSKIFAMYQQGTADAGMLARAQEALQSAIQAANPQLKGHADALSSIHTASAGAAASLVTVGTATQGMAQIVTSTVPAAASSIRTIKLAADDVSDAFERCEKDATEWANIIAQGGFTVRTAMVRDVGAAADSVNAFGDTFVTSGTQATAGITLITSKVAELVTAADSINTSYRALAATSDILAANQDKVAAATQRATQSMISGSDAAKGSATAMQMLADSYRTAAQEAADFASIANQAATAQAAVDNSKKNTPLGIPNGTKVSAVDMMLTGAAFANSPGGVGSGSLGTYNFDASLQQLANQIGQDVSVGAKTYTAATAANTFSMKDYTKAATEATTATSDNTKAVASSTQQTVGLSDYISKQSQAIGSSMLQTSGLDQTLKLVNGTYQLVTGANTDGVDLNTGATSANTGALASLNSTLDEATQTIAASAEVNAAAAMQSALAMSDSTTASTSTAPTYAPRSGGAASGYMKPGGGDTYITLSMSGAIVSSKRAVDELLDATIAKLRTVAGVKL